MVNVPWCHFCNEPECGKVFGDCEHGRRVMARQAAASEHRERSEAPTLRPSEPLPPAALRLARRVIDGYERRPNHTYTQQDYDLAREVERLYETPREG